MILLLFLCRNFDLVDAPTRSFGAYPQIFRKLLSTPTLLHFITSTSSLCPSAFLVASVRCLSNVIISRPLVVSRWEAQLDRVNFSFDFLAQIDLLQQIVQGTSRYFYYEMCVEVDITTARVSPTGASPLAVRRGRCLAA